MFDFISIHPGASLAGDILWQSSLFLAAGLAASFAFGRRPARAHRILLLAIVGGLVTPLFGQVVRRAGWGFWVTSPERASRAASSTLAVGSSQAVSLAGGDGRAATPADSPAPNVAEPMTGRPRAFEIVEDRGVEPQRIGEDRLHWRNGLGAIAATMYPSVLGVLWCVASGLCFGRLIVSLLAGRRLVARAAPVACEPIAQAAEAARLRLGLWIRPDLRASSLVSCPAIWCWGRRPIIVLPAASAGTISLDWVGVFCHELAHWVRGDQWSCLLAEVLACALPWHPLAWWTKHRLGKLAELACDDWVLAAGLPATDYAEALLNLVPSRRSALALTAVSSRYGLFGRVRHILDEGQCSPVVGRRWACLSWMLMVLASSAVAMAQSRSVQLTNQDLAGEAKTQTSDASNPANAGSKETAMIRTIRGTVLGPDGKPAVGAALFLIGQRNLVRNVPLPRDQDSRLAARTEILAKAETDNEGAFSLNAEYDPDRYQIHNGGDVSLLVKALGAGMCVQTIKDDVAEITLRLALEVVIRGRLLTPAGLAAADVRVTLDGWRDDQTEGKLYIGMTPSDDEIPCFWVQPRKTDADGRFTLEGLPQGAYAAFTFWHPAYAVDDVTVHTTVNGPFAPQSQSFRIEPVAPTFTHTLEIARPVQGRVTDKETGEPLAGLRVEMIPMRSDCGWLFAGRTDADGCYRVSGHGGAGTYITTVYPPADSGYLAVVDNQSWPIGAKVLEQNFALDKGRIVRGQLIDADTRQPIAGAAVVYQPTRGNPYISRRYDLRNTVLTNSEGRFAITALPGQGFLAVETADESYTRAPFDESYQYRSVYPQGLARLDIPSDGEPEPVEITVRKGITLETKAIGPDGHVVPDVVGFCEGMDARLIENRNNSRTFADGVFRLAGADPARAYRVYLLQSERGIGAAVELKPDPQAKRPTEIKLQPTCRVHGRLVTADGSPLRTVKVHPLLVIRDNEGELSRTDIFRNMWFHSVLIAKKNHSDYEETLRVNAQGEFVIDTLISGVRLCIFAEENDRQTLVHVPPLAPGEDRDLGTISLKEREP